MVNELEGILPLLRLLNKAQDLRMNYEDLCTQLSISADELAQIAMAANEIESVFYQDEADLILNKKLDLLDPKLISSKITQRGRFALKDVTTSTNAELMEEKDNLVTGDALVAEIQTQGRTLHGSRWITSIGTNIMLSMAFKFENLQQLLGFSLLVGVATTTALESLGVTGLKLKWPNDITFNDRKLAGILVETVPSSDGGVFAIVGIGLNVHESQSLNKQLDRPFISLEQMGYNNITRNDVCINIINEVKYEAKTFKRSGFAPFLEYWRRHDALLGRRVDVDISSFRKISGKVTGVNYLGELTVENSSNSGIIAIRSGHIMRVY